VITSPPCHDNPDQWYTERDGRRYDDELLVTEDMIREAVGAEAERLAPRPPVEVLDDLVADVTKQRLIERRQARDLCHTECPVRTICLELALTNREQYGIWGGYFPEQRRELERQMDARTARIARRQEES
jgi:hypothetical protein